MRELLYLHKFTTTNNYFEIGQAVDENGRQIFILHMLLGDYEKLFENVMELQNLIAKLTINAENSNNELKDDAEEIIQYVENEGWGLSEQYTKIC